MLAGLDDFSRTTIRRFHVERLIARGGMGEVYLATDPVLGRELALKVLRQEVTRDADRIARFIQEARAASALNHPHLTAIYDVGESAPKRDGAAIGPPVLYIAMELVAGETLREVIDARRLGGERLLECLCQVADALSAAHAAGVIHRDLKPENLMIAGEGYAKVLDFGLAKLRGDIPQRGTTSTADDAAVTTAGLLLGTVGYMSPEQAQSQALDHRTDIFSFGCVLYEAVTGTRAFNGPTAWATLKQIIQDDPPPLPGDASAAARAAMPIARRCLEKEPEKRYQSMREVAQDLRRVLRALEHATADAAAEAPAGLNRAGTLSERRWLVAAAALLVVGLTAWWMLGGRGVTTPDVTIERLTATGTAIDAAISPDGRYLAWVESAGGRQGLRVRQIGEDRSVELVPAAAVGYWGIAFARDGSRVFYTTKSASEPTGRLFTVGVLGGTPRALLDGIDSTVTLSPDGRQLAFYRAGYPERGTTALLLTDTDGQNPRVLSSTRPPEFFVPAFFAAPAWSPDGARIAASVHNAETGDAALVTIDAASGERQVFPQRFQDVTFTAWLPDGSGILFVANQTDAFREVPRKVWLQPYPRGEPRRVTPDLLEYRNVSVRADGAAFVSVGLDSVYTLWRLPLDGGEPQRISSERYDGLLGVAPLPDGHIVVSTGERGNPQLAMLDSTGSTRVSLTREGTNLWPAVTRDGHTIAFVSNRDGQTGIWRMNVDGSEPRLLAHLPRPSWLSVTPDGRFVVCASLGEAEPAVWRVPMDGGMPTLVAAGVDRPTVSPDGRLIAGINVAAGNGRLTLVTIPLEAAGDQATAPTVLGTIAPATANGLMEWTADGSGILFSTVERANVWLQRLAGGPPVRLTSLTDLGIVRGRRTFDGRNVIVARGVAQTDAYLVSNFR